MKLSGILFFIVALQLMATGYAQTLSLNLNVEKASIREVFKEIEKQSEFSFIFSDDLLPLNEKVSIKVNKADIYEVLDDVFENSDLSYHIVSDKLIVVAPKTILQQKTVTGSVVDDTGDPMPGVNIMIKGTTTGVVSDFDGKFSINVPDSDAILIFSFIGYVSQEVVVGDRINISVILSEDIRQIDEVVVVGYGTQKKVNLTGAVVSTDSKVFESRPVSSTATALQGVMPGVNITPTNGDPNQDLSINIRGTTSVNGGDPLILVDGIEISLKLLNPNDIESVSVLKDAAASAIYGVRAAFGVVLITTKSGKAGGKLTVNYSNNFGWSKATYMPEFVDNSLDHVTFTNQALLNNNASVLYGAPQVAAIEAKMNNPSLPDYIFEGKQYRPVSYRNWKKLLIKDFTPRQTHNLSISGGNEKTAFYASTSYLRQEGMIKINPDIYDRFNASLNVENQTYSWMKLGFRVRYNTSKMDEPYHYNGNTFWHQILFSSPLQGGQWLGDPNYPEYDYLIGRYFQDQNQEALLLHGGRTIKNQHEIVLTPSIDIMPIKGLKLHVDYNYARTFSLDTYDKKKMADYFIHWTATGLAPHNGPGGAINSYQKRQSQREYSSLNAFAEYEFAVAGKHHFKIMGGFNQELTKYNYYTAERQMMVNIEQPTLSLGSGDHVVSETGYEWALRGGFGRINYDYDNRYLVELVGRYDGTSRFPKDDRFVFLPSFSVGWRLSEEQFMEFARPWFDNIKIRASYGTLGNQMITADLEQWKGNAKYYPYILFLTNGTSDYYLFNNVGTELTINPPSALMPSSLTWEKVSILNGGIDLLMFNQRLDMSFDVFKRTTDDMLIQQTYPEVLGMRAPAINAGKLETKGWELSVRWRDRIGEDWQYSVGFNMSDAHAKITRWEGGSGIVTDPYKGKKVNEIWGYETAGFLAESDFVDDDPTKGLKIPQPNIAANWKVGDIKYADTDGSGVVNTGDNIPENPGDRKVIGNSTARYRYSITGDVSWKGIFVSVFFQGVGKREIWPQAQDFWPAATQYYNTQKRFLSDCWTEDNPNAYYALVRARSTQNQQNQTKYVQDASYIRLKNLTIGYELPKAWMEKIYLSRAQIYFSGENLWETNHLVGPYDPEGIFNNTSGLGDAAYGYPMQRVFSFGINVTF